MEKKNLLIQKTNELRIDGEKLKKKKEKLQNLIY